MQSLLREEFRGFWSLPLDVQAGGSWGSSATLFWNKWDEGHEFANFSN